MLKIDNYDRKLLALLQKNADTPMQKLAEKVGLSANACWRRCRQLEEAGIVCGRVALLDAARIGLDTTVLVLIRTDQHNAEWAERFRAVVSALPEVTAVYRLAGAVDYLLKVVVRDSKAYDAFYQRLIRDIAISDVSASFVMETIKDSTELPLAQMTSP